MAWPQQPKDGSHHQFYRFLSTARTFRIDTGMNRIRTLVGVLLVLIGNFFSVLSLLTSSARKNRCVLSVPKSTTTRCTAHTARPSMSVWNASSGLLDDLSNPFVQSMEELGYTDGQKEKIASELDRAELTSLSWSVWDAMFSDFLHRPEIISEQLQTDFGFSPLLAHQTRAALVHALRRELPARSSPPLLEKNTNNGGQAKSSKFSPHATESDKGPSSSMPLSSTDGPTNEYHNSVVISNSSAPPKPLFKQTVVNEHAKRRKQEPASRDYGLPADVKHRYPALYNELQAFYDFMTVPSTISQETPIKQATANVYLRHARLFLGWYVKTILADSNTRDLSLETIIPNKEKKSASIILQFLMFLRTDRKISVSYEASLLRGLTKLLKFRFRFDSTTEAGYGETSFNDIPVVRELRKLHRDANKLQRVAPHSSSLEKKWLSWPEYLQVVQSLQAELETLLKEYDGDDPLPDQESYTWAQRKIAAAFQRYLVLAIFSNVPDRQRTIRELEIGRTFVRSDDSVWTIRHAPDDYKTGKTYGERPPLQLAPSLTGLLDDFVRRWRVCLKPTSGHNKLFCQVRTGNPFTADSVYQTVGRACFAATGKRTNPHLLRDMIVTHIREHSEASEQQLEALALFMGHSLAVQRSSYDRRTLKTKVAPAVHLLQSVNAGANLGDVRK